MSPDDRLRLSRRAALLKSLAHPSRLLIIEMLERGPRCVTELAEAVGADKTTVSKHLAVLKRSGLVRDRKRGTFSDYELACACLSHFIDCVEEGLPEGGKTCLTSAADKATIGTQSCRTTDRPHS